MYFVIFNIQHTAQQVAKEKACMLAKKWAMSLAGLQVGEAGGGDPAPFPSFGQKSKEIMEELNTDYWETHARLLFDLHETSPNHMDMQAFTGDKVLIKSRQVGAKHCLGGWGKG